MRHFRLTLAVLFHAAAALVGRAQQVPPPENGPVVTHATYANSQVQLRDVDTNAPLIVPRGYPMFSGQDPAVTTQVGFQEQPSGFDLVYDFANTAGVGKPIGFLGLGIITLGPDITFMDIKEGIDPVAVNINTYQGWAEVYPAALYSPAFILSNPTYTIGISLHYPIIDYKHHVTLNLANPTGSFLNGEGGRGWAAVFSLSTSGPYAWQTVDYGALLAPGESRRYVVSVRVIKNSTEWVRTLVPYRNYFRSVYGGVRYQRETTPILGMGAADPSLCESSNPLGWGHTYRQDLNGWSQMAAALRQQPAGWGGTMLWFPSGCYWHNPQSNFPPQPASSWLTSPALSTIFNVNNGLPTVPAAGKQLGFWWGRSCETAATWDPPTLEDFDPDNPVHFNRQLGELDLLARAGATMIGLDTFDASFMPFWKQYRWMMTMRLRYPHIKFITEPTNCDIMQTLAPTFISAWDQNVIPQTQEDCYRVSHPNYLADFLVPGNEFWAGFRYNELIKYFGVVPDQARVLADMQRFAAAGYRPCMLANPLPFNPAAVVVAKTWETTVPADLQISDAYIPLGEALGTGSRPTKDGDGVVAAFRPERAPDRPGSAPAGARNPAGGAVPAPSGASNTRAGGAAVHGSGAPGETITGQLTIEASPIRGEGPSDSGAGVPGWKNNQRGEPRIPALFERQAVPRSGPDGAPAEVGSIPSLDGPLGLTSLQARFEDAFVSADISADLNSDGFVDGGDFDQYVEAAVSPAFECEGTGQADPTTLPTPVESDVCALLPTPPESGGAP